MARMQVRQGELEVDGRRLSYRLRCTARRRHVHLLVADDGVVEVRAPWRYPVVAAESVIREHRDWLDDALGRATARRSARPDLVTGSRLPLLDEQLELRVRVGGAAHSRDRVWRQACRLHVWLACEEQAVVEQLIRDWYRREARRQLGVRLAELAPRIGVQPSGLSIRAQRTRWGSCSSRGTISLNWRLLLVPGRLADYVLVHELCHLRHMDHSPAFWGLVETVMPDHASRRAELRACQATLAL